MWAMENLSWWLEQLCQPVLYPVYAVLITWSILVWVITTPLRNVGWTLGAQLCGLGAKHARLCSRILEGYLAVAKDRQLRELPAWDYVWALYEATFTVPMRVIEGDEQKFGAYGRLAFKGWDFLHEYWCRYLPNTSQELWTSTRLYARGTLNAGVASYRRAKGVVEGVIWFVILICAILVYIPLTVLRILEVVLLGWRGVLSLLVVLNLANCFYGWGPWVAYATALGVVLIFALVTIKELQIGVELDKVSPVVVASHGWTQVRDSATSRSQEELSNLRALSCEMTSTASVAPPSTAVAAGTAPAERSPAAIQAELRQSRQRVEQLEAEYHGNSVVRRGRLNASRGECPVPGTDGAVPAST